MSFETYKASWIASLSTSNFEQVIIISHFAYFEQVIIKIVILLTLNKNFFFFNIIMVNPTATENITAIKEARKLFDDVRSNLSNNEKKTIRKKLYKKKAASHFFKKRENDGTVTDRQRYVLKNIARYSKNLSKQKNSEKYGHDIEHLFSKKDNNNLNAFQEARTLFKECRSNLSLKETNEIRKKLYI